MGDRAVDTKNPSRDAKFIVAGVDPITRILDVAKKTVANHNITGGREDIVEDGISFAAKIPP